MTTTQKRAFLSLLAVAFFLCIWIVLPIWVPVFLGTLIAVTVAPWHRLATRGHNHPRLLAAVITGASMLAILGVLALLVFVVARELVPLLERAVASLRAGGVSSLYQGTSGRLLARIGLGHERVAAALSRLSEYAATRAAGIATQVLSFTTTGVLTVVFAALTCYYLLADGARLLRWGLRLSPLPVAQTQALYREFRDVVRGTLIGTGVTALFQGGAATLGYLLLRVPYALMWGALTGVGSLIPGLGTALVWVPIGVVLIATGHVARGVGVLLLGAVVIVGAADYLLRPRLVGGQVRLHVLLVLIAIFGGLEALGLLGLVVGPLVVALLVALLRIYDREYRSPDTASQPG